MDTADGESTDRLDGALELLIEVCEHAGTSGPRWRSDPTEIDAEIAQVREEIGPSLHLPRDLVHLWRHWDLDSLELGGLAPLHFFTPRDALTRWIDYHLTSDFDPQILFPVSQPWDSYEQTIELSSADSEGGTVYEYCYRGGTDVMLLAADLADLVELITCGLIDDPPDEHPDKATEISFAYSEAALARQKQLGARDLLDDWPEHWRSAEGFEPTALRPRGATHTVEQLLAVAPSAGRFEARLHAGYHTIFSVASEPGEVATLVDSTGELLVLAPPTCSGLSFGRSSRFLPQVEIDVIVDASSPAPYEVPSGVFDGDPGYMVQGVVGRYEPIVTIVAVRPLGPAVPRERMDLELRQKLESIEAEYIARRDGTRPADD